MWLSQKVTEQAPEDAGARLGVVSLGSETPAVLSDGEWRQTVLAGPGGYAWRPAIGQRVLLIQAGGESCVAGRLQSPAGLEPGEVHISAGNAEIRLLPDGEIRLTGRVSINGTEWEAPHDGISE